MKLLFILFLFCAFINECIADYAIKPATNVVLWEIQKETKDTDHLVFFWVPSSLNLLLFPNENMKSSSRLHALQTSSSVGLTLQKLGFNGILFLFLVLFFFIGCLSPFF